MDFWVASNLRCYGFIKNESIDQSKLNNDENVTPELNASKNINFSPYSACVSQIS